MTRPGVSTPFTKVYHKDPYAAIDPTRAALSAAGKTVLITAGHTGIGFSIAQNFGAAGASHVVIVGRRVEVLDKAAKELSTAHPATKYHYFAGSVTDHAQIKEIFRQIRSTVSWDIDVLVTCAAVISLPDETGDPLSEDTVGIMDTNFFGNVNLVREFLEGMPKGGFSREKVVLDVSSTLALVVLPTLAMYGVSKIAFTKWLSNLQFNRRDKGVRVHSFHPGTVWTDTVKELGVAEDAMPWVDVQLPGRFAVWLASEEASFLKGRFVQVHYDVPELIERKSEFEKDAELLTMGLTAAPAEE